MSKWLKYAQTQSIWRNVTVTFRQRFWENRRTSGYFWMCPHERAQCAVDFPKGGATHRLVIGLTAIRYAVHR